MTDATGETSTSATGSTMLTTSSDGASSSEGSTTDAGVDLDSDTEACETACSPECRAGEHACNDACIPETTPCVAPCPADEHACDGECFANDSVLACGSACEPCVPPEHAIALCEDGHCDFACEGTFRKCDETCIAAHACCTDAECDPGNACQAGTCIDVVPPQVVNIVPADRAAGVYPDDKLQITFSESMDEHAFPDAVTLAPLEDVSWTTHWNDARTVLTLSVDGGLPYATGTSLATTEARAYTLTVQRTASDVAGNRLIAEIESSFTTIREISASLEPSEVGRVIHNINPSYRSCYEGEYPDGHADVGQFSASYNGGILYAFVAFDLTPFGPHGSILDLRSATFSGTQFLEREAFYDEGLVRLVRVESPNSDNDFGPSIVDLEIEEDLGIFATSADLDPVVDITDELWHAWANHPQPLFRLGSDDIPTNTFANFICDEFRLDLTYRVR